MVGEQCGQDAGEITSKPSKAYPVFGHDHKRIGQAVQVIFKQLLEGGNLAGHPFIFQSQQHHAPMRPLPPVNLNRPVARIAFIALLCYFNHSFRSPQGKDCMITVTVRKQGGAAIMTIPADVLKMLDLDIGSVLELQITEKAFTARPTQPSSRRRYTLAELLRGATPEIMTAIQTDTAWAREGDAVGRELT